MRPLDQSQYLKLGYEDGKRGKRREEGKRQKGTGTFFVKLRVQKRYLIFLRLLSGSVERPAVP
jgi:hypothetical protein